MKSLIMSLLLMCLSVQALPEFSGRADPKFKHGYIRIEELEVVRKTCLGSTNFSYRSNKPGVIINGILEAHSLYSQAICNKFIEVHKKKKGYCLLEVTYLYSLGTVIQGNPYRFPVFRVEGLYHKNKGVKK